MGLFRATVDLTFPGGTGRGTNTWHLRTVSTNGTELEVQTLMALVSQFYSDCAPALPSGLEASWDGTALQIESAAPVIIDIGATWSVNGTDNTGVMASAAMLCVTWRTSLATRRGRGRTFVGPVGAGSVQGDGSPLDTDLAAVRSAATNLVAASASAGVSGAIVVYSPTDGVARDITGSTVSDEFAILRSRRG